MPDGYTIDTEGFPWAVLYERSRVIRFPPKVRLVVLYSDQFGNLENSPSDSWCSSPQPERVRAADPGPGDRWTTEGYFTLKHSPGVCPKQVHSVCGAWITGIAIGWEIWEVFILWDSFSLPFFLVRSQMFTLPCHNRNPNCSPFLAYPQWKGVLVQVLE